MLAKRITSFFKTSPRLVTPVDEGKTGRPFGRRAVSFVLLTLTGGVGLSALDDLVIFAGCTSKAMEKASTNKAIIEAIGEPVTRGPWYNATLAVAHKRRSVSCSFPVVGPKGTGILHLKAVRNADEKWYSFFSHREWEILIMDALLHMPANEGDQQALRIKLEGNLSPPDCKECTKGCPVPRPQQS